MTPKCRAGWLDRQARLSLWVLVALFVLLGAAYSVVVPLFEAPDEVWHFAFVQYLARHGALPVVSTEEDAIWLRESGQPPLYYWPASLIAAALDTPELPSFVRFNVAHPAVTAGSLSRAPNVFIHTPHEAFPYRGAVLAAHLVRLYSVLWGGGTIVAMYLYAREVLPGRPILALASAAVAAFNPSLVFISSVVNNDASAVCLSTLVLWMSVRVVRGCSRRYEPLALGACLGLAALSKVSALGLLAPVALALGLAWLSDRNTGVLYWRGLAIGGVAVTVAGWWFGRNLLLYGDLLGWSAWVEAGGPQPIGWLEVVRQLGRVGTRFWSPYDDLFPRWAFWAIGAAVGLAVLGWLAYLVAPGARRRAAGWSLCVEGLVLGGTWLVVLFGGLVRYMMIIPADQGRLLFPAIGPVALFLVVGWRLALPARWGRVFSSIAVAALLLLSAWSVRAIVLRFPSPLGAPPASALTSLEGDLGPGLSLLGADVDLDTVGSGDEIQVTLYWAAQSGARADLRAIVRLQADDGRTVAQRDREVAIETYPPDLWQPGDVVRDPYYLSVAGRGPAMCRIAVEVRSGQTVLGCVTSPLAVRLLGEPVSMEAIQQRVSYDLDRRASLIGYSMAAGEAVSSDVSITLYWQAVAEMSEDYHVFVHVLDATGQRIGQDDGPPLGGAYGTSHWQPGETVADLGRVALDGGALPAGASLRVGLYRLRDGARVPAYTAEGDRLPDDAIPLALKTHQ